MAGPGASARPSIKREDSDSPSPPPGSRQRPDSSDSDISNPEPAPGSRTGRATNNPNSLSDLVEQERQARLRYRALERQREDVSGALLVFCVCYVGFMLHTDAHEDKQQQDARTRPETRYIIQGSGAPPHSHGRPQPSHGHARASHRPSGHASSSRPSHHHPSHAESSAHPRDRHGQHPQTGRFSSPTHDLTDAEYAAIFDRHGQDLQAGYFSGHTRLPTSAEIPANDPHYDDGYDSYEHDDDAYYGDSHSAALDALGAEQHRLALLESSSLGRRGHGGHGHGYGGHGHGHGGHGHGYGGGGYYY